jgi:basic amino acid/polyamine antiporter, APA family
VTDATPHLHEQRGLVRGLGLMQAIALNMSNMVGVGPFITIPLMISAMNGPACLLGWAAGALLALCDGLVWAELAAAMPGAGGTFLYLREVFADTRFGRVMPFLFVWQFVFSAPLELASGYIGFAQYVSYFWRSMGVWEARALAMAVGAAVIALLWRGVTALGKVTVVLWLGMLAAVFWVIGAGMLHFDGRLAWDVPPESLGFSRGFAAGLGSAMLIAMYNFFGYYNICFVGGEVRQPERVIPRAILWSVLAVAAIYILLNLAFIAVVPWREAVNSKYIAAQFMEKLYGRFAGGALTVLILWSAFASVFTMLLGYSRVPYAAALEGYFFQPFAKLHPKGAFPYWSLLTIGGLACAASVLNLAWVVSALITARILIQFLGQILAVRYLRTSRPDIARPFRMWLYPAPALVAFVGWVYIYAASGWEFAASGALVVLSGIAAFWVWNRTSTSKV